jgi:hypothetical protein
MPDLGFQRPRTLAEVARHSDSLRENGLHLRDWLHEARKWRNPQQAVAAVAEAPELMAGRFDQGDVADAWLGAYAEYLCGLIQRPPPEWAFAQERVLCAPFFALRFRDTEIRLRIMLDTPNAFKRRNVFVSKIELPLHSSVLLKF